MRLTYFVSETLRKDASENDSAAKYGGLFGSHVFALYLPNATTGSILHLLRDLIDQIVHEMLTDQSHCELSTEGTHQLSSTSSQSSSASTQCLNEKMRK